MKKMVDVLKTPWLSLHQQPATGKPQGEFLGLGNPFAHSVAAPLFSARVLLMGIRSERDYFTEIHAKEFHEIRVLLQGGFEIIHRDNRIQMMPGDISFTRAESPFSVRNSTEEACWWMSFYIEDSSSWSDLKSRGDFVEKYESAPLMFSLLRQMLDAYRSRNILKMNNALEESEMLLRLLRRLNQRPGEEKKRVNALSELVVEIGKNPELDWDQAMMAKKVYVSPRTLSRLFKNEYGCSPLMMVTQQRLNRAMGLLANTNEPMSEVASRSGYENVTSFSRAFSKHIGTTPGRFRKNTLVEKYGGKA